MYQDKVYLLNKEMKKCDYRYLWESRSAFFLYSEKRQNIEMKVVPIGECNFSCPYCKRNGNHKKGNQIITGATPVSLQEIKQEIEKAVLEGNIIRLSGGEPCCDYTACFEIAKYVKEIGGEVSIATNGFFPNVIRKLLEQGLLDSAAIDYKANDRKRLKELTGLSDGEAEIALNNLKQTIQIVGEYQKPLEVRIPAFQETNIEELIPICEDLRRFLGDAFFFTLRLYSSVEGCTFGECDYEQVIALGTQLSSLYQSATIGIRLKWEKSNFIFLKNGIKQLELKYDDKIQVIFSI